MNWIKKVLHIGEKIKKVIKKRATKEEIASSDWTSCCKGPVLKKDLEENLWVCDACGKHHRINCRQRFDIVFGKNNYEILETPIPQDDPLDWKDSKTYKEAPQLSMALLGKNNKYGKHKKIPIDKYKVKPPSAPIIPIIKK